MARTPRASPDRLLAAAALEFAAHGFAGARVDRIARRARVNKAMLYYHFRSKAALYRTLLRRMFTLASQRLGEVAASDAAPDVKVDRAIAAIAGFIGEHGFFPAIMLREIAEGGARLDRETLASMSAMPRAFAAIVQEGTDRGTFRAVHPVFAYFTLLAPIVMYRASAPIRAEVSALHLINLKALGADAFVEHLQDTMRRALTSDTAPHTGPTV